MPFKPEMLLLLNRAGLNLRSAVASCTAKAQAIVSRRFAYPSLGRLIQLESQNI